MSLYFWLGAIGTGLSYSSLKMACSNLISYSFIGKQKLYIHFLTIWITSWVFTSSSKYIKDTNRIPPTPKKKCTGFLLGSALGFCIAFSLDIFKM